MAIALDLELRAGQKRLAIELMTAPFVSSVAASGEADLKRGICNEQAVTIRVGAWQRDVGAG